MTEVGDGLVNERTPQEMLTPLFFGDEKAFLAAIFNVQCDMPNIAKNGKGEKRWYDKKGNLQKFEYEYVLFKDLMPIVRDQFKKHRIVILQAPFPCLEDGNFYVMTFFRHVNTGGGVRFAYPVCSLKEMHQQDIAAANTAAKRHAIVEGLVIVADDDKDAMDAKALMAGKSEEEESAESSPEDTGAKAPYKAVQKVSAKAATKAAEGFTKALTAQEIEGQRKIGMSLWRRALSPQFNAEEVEEAVRKARKIDSEGVRDPVLAAISVRKHVFDGEFGAARESLKKIPQQLLSSKIDDVSAEEILNGFIDEEENKNGSH